MLKTCSKCGQAKDLEAFNKDASKSDGLYSSCRACYSKYNKTKPKTRYQKDLHNKVTTKYRNKLRNNYPEHLLYQTAKTSSLARNLAFDITVDDIVIPEFCPVLGIKLDILAKKQFNSPSIDRVDNNLGYIKGNVRIISSKANIMKRDNTVETLEAILKYIKEHKQIE